MVEEIVSSQNKKAKFTFWSNLSLRWKVIIPPLLLSLVVVPIASGIWLNFAAKSFHQAMIHRGNELNALLSTQIATAVALGDRIWLSRIISGIVKGSEITYCAVHDDKGVLLVSDVAKSFRSKKISKIITARGVENTSSGAIASSVIRYLRSNKGDSILEMQSPLFFATVVGSEETLLLGGDEDNSSAEKAKQLLRVGTLRLGICLSKGEAELRYRGLRQVGVFLGLALLGIAFLSLIVHFAVVPLNQMTDRAIQVARGDLNELVEERGSDEVGGLAEAFNYMIRRLRRSRGFNDLVGANIPLGLVVVDADGLLIEGNQQFASIVGTETASVNGSSFGALLEVDGFSEILSSVNNGEVRVPFHGLVDLAEHELFLDCVAVALPPTISGEPRTMIVLQDVTQKKEAHRRQELMEKRLMQSSRLASLGQLAAGAAHEFNNILQIITNYVEISIDDLGSGCVNCNDLKDNLEHVLHGTERASQIISRMLTFARRLTPRRSLVVLSDLIKETIDLVNLDFESRGVRVETHFEQIPNVSVDAGQMQQVLINLVKNAFHAMTPHGGVLGIETGFASGSKDEVEVRIRDTGRGIPSKDLSRIFDPFFSTKGVYAHDDEQRKLEGTGLGLALSYGIISNHGGDITVSSQEGEGSLFTIHLPVNVEFEAKNPSPASSSLSVDTGDSKLSGSECSSEGNESALTRNKTAFAGDEPSVTGKGSFAALSSLRVLVVDDEKEIAFLLTRFLKSKGLKDVQGVHSADEALLCLREKKYWDVVISDVLMPGVSGIELAQIVRKEALAKQVIMLTGKFTSEVNDECTSIGVDACLSKPLKMEELLTVLSKCPKFLE